MPGNSRFPKQRTGGIDFRTFTEMAFDEGATMITDEQLKEWRALADAATAGPWDYNASFDGWRTIVYFEDTGEIDDGDKIMRQAGRIARTYVDGDKLNPGNAAFIAAAREAVPALIDEVERLRARLENADLAANNERNLNA